jgi:hypothetical protein
MLDDIFGYWHYFLSFSFVRSMFATVWVKPLSRMNYFILERGFPALWRKNWKGGDSTMIKVRLSGTKRELRGFVKKMSRSKHYHMETTSDFKPYKGNNRFRIEESEISSKENPSERLRIMVENHCRKMTLEKQENKHYGNVMAYILGDNNLSAAQIEQLRQAVEVGMPEKDVLEMTKNRKKMMEIRRCV